MHTLALTLTHTLTLNLATTIIGGKSKEGGEALTLTRTLTPTLTLNPNPNAGRTNNGGETAGFGCGSALRSASAGGKARRA